MQLTTSQIKDYIKTATLNCPLCHSNAVCDDSFDSIADSNEMAAECDCENCFASFNLIYKLVDVTLLSSGLLNVTKLSKLQTSRYLDHPLACVICQNDDSDDMGFHCGDLMKRADSKADMEVSCPCCKAEWKDKYTLTNIQILDRGECK